MLLLKSLPYLIASFSLFTIAVICLITLDKTLPFRNAIFFTAYLSGTVFIVLMIFHIVFGLSIMSGINKRRAFLNDYKACRMELINDYTIWEEDDPEYIIHWVENLKEFNEKIDDFNAYRVYGGKKNKGFTLKTITLHPDELPKLTVAEAKAEYLKKRNPDK